MKRTKSSGPRREPCGTPVSMVVEGDHVKSTVIIQGGVYNRFGVSRASRVCTRAVDGPDFKRVWPGLQMGLARPGRAGHGV